MDLLDKVSEKILYLCELVVDLDTNQIVHLDFLNRLENMFKIIKKEYNQQEELIYKTDTKELIATPTIASDITFSFIYLFLGVMIKIRFYLWFSVQLLFYFYICM